MAKKNTAWWKNNGGLDWFYRYLNISKNIGIGNHHYSIQKYILLQILVELIYNQNIKTVLEIGCGFGRILFELQAYSSELKLYGIDINVDAFYQGVVSYLRKKNRIEIINLNTNHLKIFPDKSFDMVYTCEHLMHISDKELVDIEKNMLRIAKKSVVTLEKNNAFYYLDRIGGIWSRDYFVGEQKRTKYFPNIGMEATIIIKG